MLLAAPPFSPPDLETEEVKSSLQVETDFFPNGKVDLHLETEGSSVLLFLFFILHRYSCSAVTQGLLCSEFISTLKIRL